ncbi:MAG: thioredoxin-disulfide reductase [Lachnospiraceae bacterium]|nr:thioredoxin-disulfide reductase [Lachnospiraceae bacterium]
MHDIIIVGAGVAGLSAAIYGLRAGKSVLLFEEKTYGGQIINTPEIENYPGIKKVSGFEFATNLYEQAMELGAEIKYEKVLGITTVEGHKIIKTDSDIYEAKSVIIATGAKNRPLGVARETELIGAGVSYCATCDGMFFRGKDVAVVGGGNTALEDALFLASYCNKVYVIHRRDAFRGEDKLVESLKDKDNVSFCLDSQVTKLVGLDRVEGVEVSNKKTGDIKTIAVSGVFVAIGQMPDNKAFEELIATDEYGYIVASENCKTKEPGVFVAGDCRTKTVRQLTTAAADGAVAALAAGEYLQTM